MRIDGRLVEFVWRRSTRRRHAHLVVDEHSGLELRTPAWARAEDAERMVLEQRDWVVEALDRHQQRLARRPHLADGSLLPYIDERLELRLRPAHRPRVSRRGDQLVAGLPDTRDDDSLRRALERWYRGQAHAELDARLGRLGLGCGLRHSGLTIRAQRRRWGSCNARGHINLNWRLMLMPGELVDYVLLHELCHLRHMDHSPAFWALLASHMPDYRQRMQRIGAVRGTDLVL